MPTQTYIGSFAINVYTLYIALGALAGAGYMLWQLRHRPWHELSRALNGVLIMALAALIAGRVGYIALHFDYFQEHLAEVAWPASPGLSEHAAIIGGLAGLVIARQLRHPVPVGATLVLATLIGMGASLGCIPNGCAYGREVYWTDGWAWQLRVDWPDAYTLNNPRLPSQLFLLAWLLICLCAAYVYIATLHPERGWQGYSPILLWIVLFAGGDFVLQFMRADQAPVIGPLRAPQWVDIGFVVLGSLWLALKHIHTPG
jgi:prolipoprotein diacylglyceryltransferase